MALKHHWESTPLLFSSSDLRAEFSSDLQTKTFPDGEEKGVNEMLPADLA